MPDDTSVVLNFYFDEINTLESGIKDHLKGYYTYLLPRYLPSTIKSYHDAIRSIATKLAKGATFDEAVDATVTEKPTVFVSPIKSLVRYLLLNEYEGLSFDKAEDVLRLEGYTSNKNSYLALFTMD